MSKIDAKKLTAEAIEEAWHDLGNGTKVKEKMTKKMDEKLDGLVKAAKSGNWKNELEEAIVQMITYNYSSNESLMWYGHLVTACDIKRDLNMPSPAGVRFMFNKFELFINPLMFGLYSTDEQIAILKHEMLHIINLHITRQKDRDHKKWNYGTDISINQLIPNIPEDGLQPERFKFEKNLNAEQYYDMIPTNYDSDPEDGEGDGEGSCSSSCPTCNGSGEGGEPSDEKGEGQGQGEGEPGEGQGEGEGQGSGKGNPCPDCNGSGEAGDGDVVDDDKKLKDMIGEALNAAQHGQIGDHGKWNESEGDEQAAKEITRQMTETATNKSRGMSPSECDEALQLLKMKEQINWKKELRRIVGNRKANSRLTIKKNDRRFPHRRDLRGKTKDHTIDVCVVLDVSGSMSDEEIIYGLTEIKAIAEKAGAGVTIIQVDTEPKVVEDFDPKAKTFNRRGYGGTYMSKSFEMIVTDKIPCNVVINITDGYIESTLDGPLPKVPFIFLVTQDKDNLAIDVNSYKRMKSHTLKIDGKGR